MSPADDRVRVSVETAAATVSVEVAGPGTPPAGTRPRPISGDDPSLGPDGIRREATR